MNSRWILPLLLVALGIFIFLRPQSYEQPEKISYSEFMAKYKTPGSLAKVTINLVKMEARATSAKDPDVKYKVQLPNDPELPEKLIALNPGVDVELERPRFSEGWMQLLGSIVIPLMFFLFIYVMLIRQMQAGSGQALSFGRSRHKRFTNTFERVTFDDVAGVDEAKEELAEVVEFLKEPEKFRALGARIPRGVLLTGAPGTGKTLLARAIAGEANVPFLYISGADFVEMFVGVGASRVRDLFDQAKHHERCIVFIDEIDAVGRQRGSGLGGGHDEREQTLNQLLVEMDGFDKDSGVIVLAATNRPDVLDPALLRPGRFDRRIVVDIPDLKGREEIFKLYIKERPIADDVTVEALAKRTVGFTGADIEILVNEAAILAARRGKKVIEMVDFEDATDRVQVGLERRSRVLSQEERYALACHESGHALVGLMIPEADPIHKVSTASRGQALGFTLQVPEEDRQLFSRSQLLAKITATLGGRAAEELCLGDVYTGSMNDLEQVSKMARAMVCNFGMSEKMGLVSIGNADRQVFIGRDLIEERHVSDETAKIIDDEIRRIVRECYDRALQILSQHRAALDKIIEVLMEKETITGDELKQIVIEVEGPDAIPPKKLAAEIPSRKSNEGDGPATLERAEEGSPASAQEKE